MDLLNELNVPIPETLINNQVVDLTAVVLFAMTLLFLAVRLLKRIKLGREYLDALPSKTAEIKKAIITAARQATSADPSGKQSKALVPWDPSEGPLTINVALAFKGTKYANELRQPLAELRAGLLSFADNLAPSGQSTTGEQRFISFQRLSDSFSGQLPDRFVAAQRAMAFSRLSVQSGLAFSVLFILLALAQNDAEAVLRNVTFKFGFTLVGLAASLIVQLMLKSATRKASLAFLKFEEDLDQQLDFTVTSPLAGSYRLLQDQRVLKDELKHTLDVFSEQIGKLEQGAAALGSSAGQAAGTLTDVMTATREASAEVAEQVAAHVQAMADAMEKAQADYRTKVDGHASAVVARYGGALKTASEDFKRDVRQAGADFDGTVSASGNSFMTQVDTAAGRIDGSSNSFAAEANKAGLGFSSSVTQAGGKFSTTVQSASKDFKSDVDASAQNLSTSCADTTDSFEQQFEAASKRYLESVGKIGVTTAEIANIQASLVQRVANEEARARARIRELTSEAVTYVNDVMNEKKAEILEELRKELDERSQITIAEILPSGGDSQGADASGEVEPTEVPVESPTEGPNETEPDTSHAPPNKGENKGPLEG